MYKNIVQKDVNKFNKITSRFQQKINGSAKFSVQGVVALDGHFSTLCQELEYYIAILFFDLQKEKYFKVQ